MLLLLCGPLGYIQQWLMCDGLVAISEAACFHVCNGSCVLQLWTIGYVFLDAFERVYNECHLICQKPKRGQLTCVYCISLLFVLSSAEVHRVGLCQHCCSIVQQWLASLSWQADCQHCLLTCFAVMQIIDIVMLCTNPSEK